VGLFDRGRKRGAQAAATGQPAEDLWFEARCPAGHELTGRRLEEFQAVRCPECGEGIFVLPTSWLPVPLAASPADLVPLGRIRDVAVEDDQPEPDEPEDEAPQPSAGRAPIALKPAEEQRKSTDMPVDDPAARYQVATPGRVAQADFEKIVAQDARRKAAPTPEASPPAAALRQKPVEAAEPDTHEDEFDEDHFQPPREPFFKRIGKGTWIGLGVVTVIALTVFIQLRQAHRERLPRVANLGRTEGIAKFESGQFDEAKQILGDAAAAYDEMKENSDEARAIRQAAREAAIFADLASRPLEEILDKVAADGASLKEFQDLDKGRSVIIESRITKTPQQGGFYDIDYRVAVGPGPTPARPLGQIDLKGLKLLDDLKPNVGETLLIGARLRELKLEDGTWWVRLDPSSGVMLTNWKALAAFGWPVTDKAKADSNATDGAKP